jgi:hypothetical protein
MRSGTPAPDVVDHTEVVRQAPVLRGPCNLRDFDPLCVEQCAHCLPKTRAVIDDQATEPRETRDPTNNRTTIRSAANYNK